MKVWLIESGRYENHGIDHVIASPEDARDVLVRSFAEWPGQYEVGELETSSSGDLSILVTHIRAGREAYDVNPWEVETR